ncbi:MAG: hypothetical protein WCK63_16715 [Betaproteobacteria bacterium]
MDHARFQQAVQNLYSTVHELEAMFPERPFTPDGHLVGSLGECLVADAYCLKLMPPSNGGFDALAPDGREVEIKATQGKYVAFRSCPKHVIVIRINPDGSFDEIFNGPGALIWENFVGKARPSNGQYQITLTRLCKLQSQVLQELRLPRS